MDLQIRKKGINMNKVVLVTGSRRGIGKATAIKFAENGYDVVINSRSGLEELNELKKEIENKYNVRVLIEQVDISKEEDVKRMCQDIEEKFGHIDVLVNNAAIVYDMELEDRTVDIFRETIDVNLTGTFMMCKYIGKIMMKQTGGGTL